MERVSTQISLFLYVDTIDAIEKKYKKPVVEVLEELAEKLVYTQIIKRCARCNKEVRLLVPKSRAYLIQRFEAVERIQCNHCNPRSRWERVEET